MDIEDLKTVLDYEPATGVFRWLVPRGRVSAGASAGTLRGDGYRAIRINRVTHLAHRLAWLMTTGLWPKGEIDHINGVRADNRWLNLRDVSRDVNQQNQKRAQVTNGAGLLGVSRADAVRGFRARIFFEGEEHHLGTYPTAQEAHAAYLEAKRKLHAGCTI